MNTETKLGYLVSGTVLALFIVSLVTHAHGTIDLRTLPELAYFIFLTLVAAAGYYTLGDAMGEGADLVDNAQDGGEDETDN